MTAVCKEQTGAVPKNRRPTFDILGGVETYELRWKPSAQWRGYTSQSPTDRSHWVPESSRKIFMEMNEKRSSCCSRPIVVNGCKDA